MRGKAVGHIRTGQQLQAVDRGGQVVADSGPWSSFWMHSYVLAQGCLSCKGLTEQTPAPGNHQVWGEDLAVMI